MFHFETVRKERFQLHHWGKKLETEHINNTEELQLHHKSGMSSVSSSGTIKVSSLTGNSSADSSHRPFPGAPGWWSMHSVAGTFTELPSTLWRRYQTMELEESTSTPVWPPAGHQCACFCPNNGKQSPRVSIGLASHQHWSLHRSEQVLYSSHPTYTDTYV